MFLTASVRGVAQDVLPFNFQGGSYPQKNHIPHRKFRCRSYICPAPVCEIARVEVAALVALRTLRICQMTGDGLKVAAPKRNEAGKMRKKAVVRIPGHLHFNDLNLRKAPDTGRLAYDDEVLERILDANPGLSFDNERTEPL